MNLIENVSLAFSSLRAGKMRALLTMLGIIIGIGSVIAIVTLGNSLQGSITSMLSEMGANQVQAFVSTRERNVNREMADSDYMTMDWIMEFRDKYPEEIDSVVMWEAAGAGQVRDGRKYANVFVYGGPADAVHNNNFDIIRGRDINDRDVLGAKNVGVVSDKLVSKIFTRGENPIGQEIQVDADSLGLLTFTIIGVYKYETVSFLGQNFMGTDEDVETELTIPISTAKRITGASEGFGYFSARLRPGIDAFMMTENMQEFFDEKYRGNQYFQVFAQNNEGMLNEMNSMLSTLTVAISIIAAISLLVGGIGVMNIMLVSVTERTREIGTRKALGARNSAIRVQFIIEAMIICLVGGVIGIVFGLVLGAIGSGALGFPAQPSVPVIVIAVLFSMGIGVFFGFYPANKASKLDPIEALRYE